MRKMRGKHTKPVSRCRCEALKGWEDAFSFSGFFFYGLSVIVVLMAPLYAALPMAVCLAYYTAAVSLHKRRKRALKNG